MKTLLESARIESSRTFLVIALLTSLVSGLSISRRIHVENENRATMIAADVDTIQSYSAAQGLTLEEGLKRLKAKGLNGLVISEDTVAGLISDGRAELSGITLQSDLQVRSLVFPDKQTVERVSRGLRIRFGDLVKTLQPRDNRLALPPVDASSLRSTAIGLDPALTALAKTHGLGVIARCSNPVGVTSKAVAQTIGWASETGATIFLAQGEQVLGRRDAMDATVNALRTTGMLYASPEFAKLGGDQEMLASLGDRSVRLHSAQAAELDKLSLPAAIERYRKAARERNMRVLLLRSVSNASDAPLDSFGDFVEQVSRVIQKEGLTLGQPVPYTEPGVSKAVKVLIGLLGGIAGVWVAVQMLGRKKGLILGAAFAVLITLGCTREGSALQIAAFLFSLVFPIGAFYMLLESKMHPWLALIVGTTTAMVSGLGVAGLLNGVEYYIRAEAFMGVKPSVFGPVLLLGLVGFGKFNDLKSALKDPITWGAAALSVVMLGVIGLILVRTGNDNPNTVSGGEMAFRGLLETLLPVRPRSKEFLLAFPALFVGLSMLHAAGYDRVKLGRLGGWVSLLLMLGVVGLTDVVNTLCHLHTPVMISVIRNIEGIVLGGLFGQVIWLLVRRPVSKLMNLNHG